MGRVTDEIASVEVVPDLVSIVVASYNHAAHLERRLESLISQTYHNIEILIIDDCSPDNSVEVLRQYEPHPKVKLVVRETNAGWVTVFNQGIEMSSGEFILFANCDDDCDPCLIENLVKFREEKAKKIEKKRLMQLTTLCKLKVLPQYVFRNTSPAIFGGL